MEKGLLNTQKKRLAHFIYEVGMNTADFQFKDNPDAFTTAHILFLPNKDFHFRIFFVENTNWYCAFSPGGESFDEDSHESSFKGVLQAFNRWLVFLLAEHFTQDPWAELENNRSYFSQEPPEVHADENIPQVEAERLIKSFHDLEDKIKAQFTLTDEKIATLELNISELEKAVKQVSRRNFMRIARDIFYWLPKALDLIPDDVYTVIRETIGEYMQQLPS